MHQTKVLQSLSNAYLNLHKPKRPFQVFLTYTNYHTGPSLLLPIALDWKVKLYNFSKYMATPTQGVQTSLQSIHALK